MANTAEYKHIKQEQSLPVSSSRKVYGIYFLFLLLNFFSNFLTNKAIAQDTSLINPSIAPVLPEAIHSPRKATIYAMVLPGLGQAYNHKYWKIPVVYAGFAACIYFIQYNNKYYQNLKDAYEWSTVTSKTNYPPAPVNNFHPIPDPPNEYATKYPAETLKSYRDSFRHDLEVSYIFTGVWYILTVVDAVVDAHFFDYDISNDLTLQVKPWAPALGTNTAYGISGGVNLTLRF